jgi:hypothetical protein
MLGEKSFSMVKRIDRSRTMAGMSLKVARSMVTAFSKAMTDMAAAVSDGGESLGKGIGFLKEKGERNTPVLRMQF